MGEDGDIKNYNLYMIDKDGNKHPLNEINQIELPSFELATESVNKCFNAIKNLSMSFTICGGGS